MSDSNTNQNFLRIVSEKKSDIANKWLISTSAITVLLTVQIIYRASVIGMNKATVIQLFAISAIWVITLFRHQLSFKARAFFLVTVVSISGFVGAVQLGILGYGLVVIVISAPLICLFFDLRMAIYVLIIQTTIGTFIGYYHVRNGALPDFDYVAYLSGPTAWIVEISTYVILAVLMCLSTSALVEYLLSALADQTKKSHELSLSQSENQRILDHMVNPFCRLTPDGEIVLTSKSVKHIFGYTSKYLHGKNLSDFADKPEDVIQFLREVEENPAEPHQLEFRFPPKDSSQIICVFRAQCWQSTDGKTLGIEGTLSDVTEQRVALQSLYHGRKLKASGLLAAGISHDFNNNLSVILGCLEAIEPNIAKNSETKKLLELAYKAGDKAVLLSHRLQKISPNEMPTARSRIDIGDAVSSFMPILRRVAAPNIQTHFSRAAGPIYVNLETSAFEDVIFNLISNARDAMPDGGEIFVQTNDILIDDTTRDEWPNVPPARYAVLSVRDTGKGIPEGDQERIFEPFYTSKGLENGTGLGLSIAAGFVAASNGYLRVDSTVGEGSQFDILFPLSIQEAPVA